jgi:outer membrane protein OmpA-like peptidoglycan-associated protein
MPVSHPHHVRLLVARLGVVLSLLITLCFPSQRLAAQEAMDNPNLESFNVPIAFGGKLGSYSFPAYYEDPGALYLPIDDLLNLFKIVRTVTADGQIIKGYVETEDRPYEINLPQRFILFEGKRTVIKEKDALMDLGTLYLRTDLMKEAFGFNFDFNFRTLTAKFTTTFELPVIKFMNQERNRDKLSAVKADEVDYDTILPRDYHWLRGGMIDWSLASSQSNKYPGETRMELGGGVELFGGETNVFLNWSDRYGMPREQQQYYWRWADNSARALRQVQLGRVNARSIASLLAPMDGFMVTNAPTTVRKALGTYQIADYTEPDWVIELYVNNVMVGYTRSDASGFYRFEVPIVYGSTTVTLRFYGPGGEVRSEEKRFNMPYNMLPTGEFEYKAVGGSVMDTLNSLYGRVELNYGVSRWLTAGAGMEYLTSISTNPEIPFVNLTFQPIPRLLITGEYAHKVRTRATLNMTLPANATLDMIMAVYSPGQQAIIYNYLQERSVSLSMPYRLMRLSGYTKALFRQNLYENFNYNSAEWMVSGNYGKLNANVSHFVNWTSTGHPNIYANVAAGWRFNRSISLRPSAQYNYTSGNWISLRGEVEARLFSNGYASLRYENNFLAKTNNINLSFRYDLPFMSTSLSGGWGNRQFQAAQSARGGFAFGSGNRYVHADKRGTVGRSGIAINPFVDMNFNGVQDKGEPSTERIRVRCSGGQVVTREKDSIIRIVGLEAFTEYTLTLDESTFDNLAWRLPFKTVKLTTDPNQFKTIMVAVKPMGEISGLVTDELGNGIGRILVTFTDEAGQQVAKTLTESDGYYTYVGFRPGTYVVGVDTTQLRVLRMTAEPTQVKVNENVQGDLVEADVLTLIKQAPVIIEHLGDTASLQTNQDTLLQYYVLFDHDQTDVRAEYAGSMQQLALFLNTSPNFKLEIQGHTDTVGGAIYNQRLSLKRAGIVAQYLMSNGVKADQLSVVGYGESRPVNDNASELERAANRRVTFDKNIPGSAMMGATAGSLPEALMAAAPMHVRKPGDVSNKPAMEVPVEPALEASSLTGGEHIVARKKTRDMMFLDLGNGRYIVQFGAFKSGENAHRLSNRLNSLLKGGVEVVHENELYKVQTVVINSVEETVGLAKKVRLSTILEN